jgi:ferric-dicitrate binding protein FerR (iron transport regulator)
MNKELLKKYFENRCSEEELKSVINFIKSSSFDDEGKSLLYDLWEETSADNRQLTDFDHLLDRIHHKVNLYRLNEKGEGENRNRIKIKKLFSYIKNAAAILLLPVLGFSFYMTVKYSETEVKSETSGQAFNEVYSSVDAITKVTLPDGTIVWLNHRSSLRYPANFRNKIRSVELMGEGYFEVAHNPEMPFIVNAADVQIIALGTAFNVLAYPEEDKIETSLINGVVKMQRIDESEGVVKLADMNPSDLVVYNKSNREIVRRSIHDDRYFSWKTGKLIFNREPMGEVVRKLSRWFNVEIRIEDQKLYDLTFTGTFINETLPQVMELIQIGTPIRYSITSRKELDSGTFSKRVVTLRYEKNNY